MILNVINVINIKKALLMMHLNL